MQLSPILMLWPDGYCWPDLFYGTTGERAIGPKRNSINFLPECGFGICCWSSVFFFFCKPKIFQSIISFPGSSSGERTILNQSALKAFWGHPVFGVGPGQLLSALPDYFPPGYWKIQPPHNVFILVLAETGIFGFAVLLTGILRCILQLKKFVALPRLDCSLFDLSS